MTVCVMISHHKLKFTGTLTVSRRKIIKRKKPIAVTISAFTTVICDAVSTADLIFLRI